SWRARLSNHSSKLAVRSSTLHSPSAWIGLNAAGAAPRDVVICGGRVLAFFSHAGRLSCAIFLDANLSHLHLVTPPPSGQGFWCAEEGAAALRDGRRVSAPTRSKTRLLRAAPPFQEGPKSHGTDWP